MKNSDIVEIVSKIPDTLNKLRLKSPLAWTSHMMDIIVRHCPHNRAYKPGKWMKPSSHCFTDSPVRNVTTVDIADSISLAPPSLTNKSGGKVTVPVSSIISSLSLVKFYIDRFSMLHKSSIPKFK